MSRQPIPRSIYITHDAHEKVKKKRGRRRAIKKLGLEIVSEESDRWLLHGTRMACQNASSLYAFGFYHDIGDACECQFCVKGSGNDKGLWWMTWDWEGVRRVGSPDLEWYCETPE